ncbi:hypothetical protein F5882DRAFT_419236 [Hyaloscypha sp. PMI_1271]|nr:hypothetical protein F5882DRAFT_419236 [Hyaloscypha sp. PMI_1271]
MRLPSDSGVDTKYNEASHWTLFSFASRLRVDLQRSSKRLQGRVPPPEKSPKRARRPNRNTLAEFYASQSLVPQRKIPKKQAKAPIDIPEPNIANSPVPRTPITIPSNPVVLQSTPLNSTPLPKRARKAIQPPPPPFDPSIKQEVPHNISIFITPVIDDVRKEKTFSKTMDINSTIRDDFNDLRAFLYTKYIKQLLTTLRQMEKDSDRDRKIYHKIYTEVIYRTFDRQKTPPLSANRARGGNKDNDDDLELPSHLPLKLRDSTTNRQLQEKAAHDMNLPAQEYIRQKIFVWHICKDLDYPNHGSYYYEISLLKEHHTITLNRKKSIKEDTPTPVPTPIPASTQHYRDGPRLITIAGGAHTPNRGLAERRDEPYMNPYIPEYSQGDYDYFGPGGGGSAHYYRNHM